MRIVHVADYFMPKLGYQESVLPRYHARHGHEVHVITSDRYTNVPHYDSSWRPLLGERIVGAGTEVHDQVTVHRMRGALEYRDRIMLRGLHRKLADIEPDVIFGHGTTNYTAIQLARIAKRLGVPLFLDCHMLFTVQDQSRLGRAFYWTLKKMSHRLITPWVTRYFGVADEACDFLIQAQGIPPEKVELLSLGLDTDVFSPRQVEASALRARLGLGGSDIVVMQTGKLTPDKGPHLLAEALAPLMAENPRVHIVLVGGGSPEYMSKVRGAFTSEEAQARVLQEPLVPASELAVYFTAADVVVFPAGSSLSCIEAAGCGAAVVMTDLPAGRWRAEHGVGVTYPNEDVRELRGVLVGLIGDAQRRAEIAKTAHDAVMSKFSYDSIARDLESKMAAAVGRR